MKYSVVMPIYLREEAHRQVVEQTIKSVVDAGGYDELIIVDDCSPIEIFKKDKPDCTYIRHDKNGGISKAWNTGKNSAHGEFVVIINDDISIPSGWLDSLSQGFGDDTAGVVAPMRGGPSIRPTIMHIDPYTDKRFYPGYCFMLKKDRFFEDFDEQFTTNCGDTDYWHRIELSGLQCVRVGLCVWHKEGDVLHAMDYNNISRDSINKFIKKWGFNPQKEFYV